jgi:hypothetical protein
MSLPQNPTYEQAFEAAKKVRNYMNEGTNLYGPDWVNETFDLAYILQQWRRPSLLDPSQNRNDFEDEYNFIHRISSHNWHMYEEGPDNI